MWYKGNATYASEWDMRTYLLQPSEINYTAQNINGRLNILFLLHRLYYCFFKTKFETFTIDLSFSEQEQSLSLKNFKVKDLNWYFYIVPRIFSKIEGPVWCVAWYLFKKISWVLFFLFHIFLPGEILNLNNIWYVLLYIQWIPLQVHHKLNPWF